MLPNGKATGALFVTEATEQLSPVVGAPSATPVAVQPELVVTETGTVLIVGFSLSVTVIVFEPVIELLEASVTV